MSTSIIAAALSPAEGTAEALAAAADKQKNSALRNVPTRDEKVLQQFESVMLSMMLKQMRSSASEDGLFPGDKSDTLGGMFDTYMGDHLAESGGLGLTDSLGDFLNRGPASIKEVASLQNELNTKAMEAYSNELSRSGGF